MFNSAASRQRCRERRARLPGVRSVVSYSVDDSEGQGGRQGDPGGSQPAAGAAALAGYQRVYLRGLAHDLKPIVQVGQSGVTPEVLAAVDIALTDHELVKVRLYRPEDKKALSAALAAGTGAELCGLIGHTVILYRKHPDKPRIRLPVRRDGDA